MRWMAQHLTIEDNVWDSGDNGTGRELHGTEKQSTKKKKKKRKEHQEKNELVKETDLRVEDTLSEKVTIMY